MKHHFYAPRTRVTHWYDYIEMAACYAAGGVLVASILGWLLGITV